MCPFFDYGYRFSTTARSANVLVQALRIVSAMNPTDSTSLYADSPERMLYLSILLLFAVMLLVLHHHNSTRKRAAALLAELPSVTRPGEAAPHWVVPAERHR
jgi:hypothetical protein